MNTTSKVAAAIAAERRLAEAERAREAANDEFADAWRARATAREDLEAARRAEAAEAASRSETENK